MSLLQAYLQNSRAQRVLNSKPGQKGFSLLELVIVVAILAVLAVIAVPSFTNIAAKGRTSAAKTTLANALKECRVSEADSGIARKTALVDGSGLTFTAGLKNTACANVVNHVCVANNPVEAYGINLSDGAKGSGTLGTGAVAPCAASTAFSAW